MPGCLGSAPCCCVTLVESPALSGPLFLPVQESCHTTLSFTSFHSGHGAWSFLDTERRGRAAPALGVEAGGRWHVVVCVERETSEEGQGWQWGVSSGFERQLKAWLSGVQ